VAGASVLTVRPLDPDADLDAHLSIVNQEAGCR
jgi:hypothetical protein